LYPCDLLFVHRDAERASPESRLAEIADALKKARSRIDLPPAVCVVPVRMQEAWLLFDVQAIRKAAGNPNGRAVLNLPRVGDLETKPNPKKLLNELLCRASELKGRHLKRFKRSIAPARVAEFIDDFGPLRDLCAFKKLEDDIKEIVASGGW